MKSFKGTYIFGSAQFLCWVILILIGVNASAQDFDNYQPITAEGPLPEDILQKSSEKFYDLKTTFVDTTREKKELKETFFLESSFAVDKILKSGKVIFNDTLSSYVRRVADIALQHKPELRESLSFYIVNAPAINAFTSDNGYVLINLGFLASLDNEAELAYVICHEAVHYLHKHSLKQFLFEEELEQKEGLFNKRQKLEDRLLKKSQYSIKQEIKADTQGARIFMKTGYDTSAISSVLSKVNAFDLPFEPSVTFSPYLFENPYFVLGKEQMLQSNVPVKTLTRDSISTHPKSQERVNYMREYLAKHAAPAGSSRFLVSEDDFNHTNKMAKYELIRSYLKNGNFDRALYTIVNIRDEGEMNHYLEKSMAKTWYYIAMFKFVGVYDSLMPPVNAVHPEMQWYNHLTLHTDRTRSITLALHYLNSLPPGDPEVRQMLVDLMHAAVFVLHDYRYTSGDRFNFREAIHDFSKKNKIFAENLKQTFDALEDKIQRLSEMSFHEFIEWYTDYSTPPLDTMLVVDPYYLKLDLRRETKVNYMEEEAKLAEYMDYLEHNANLLDMEVKTFSFKDLGEGQIEKYNQVRFLKSYLEDKMIYFPYNFVPVDYNKTIEICQELGVSNLAITTAASIKDQHPGFASKMIASILFPPLLPWGLERTFTPRDDFFNFIGIYNVEADQFLGESHHWMKQKDNEGTINATLYYNLQKIKHGKKE